jgi:hypothetical protein
MLLAWHGGDGDLAPSLQFLQIFHVISEFFLHPYGAAYDLYVCLELCS